MNFVILLISVCVLYTIVEADVCPYMRIYPKGKFQIKFTPLRVKPTTPPGYFELDVIATKTDKYPGIPIVGSGKAGFTYVRDNPTRKQLILKKITLLQSTWIQHWGTRTKTSGKPGKTLILGLTKEATDQLARVKMRPHIGVCRYELKLRDDDTPAPVPGATKMELSDQNSDDSVETDHDDEGSYDDDEAGNLYRCNGAQTPRACILTSKNVRAWALPQYTDRDTVAITVTLKDGHNERQLMVASVYMAHGSETNGKGQVLVKIKDLETLRKNTSNESYPLLKIIVFVEEKGTGIAVNGAMQGHTTKRIGGNFMIGQRPTLANGCFELIQMFGNAATYLYINTPTK